MTNNSTTPLWLSIIPAMVLIVLLSISVIIFRTEIIQGAAQISLIISGFFAALIALMRGCSWDAIEKNIIATTSNVIQAIIILLLIGTLISVWILAGVVPTIIVLGLKILNPKLFLFATCLITCLVSFATGSSWSTAGTIGVALIGIGNAAGINSAMTAGAIVSGAYFGDKMSPFSETTNLAPSMAECGLFEHIRHMVYTTTPALLITLVIFFLLGMGQLAPHNNSSRIEAIVQIIQSHFNTSLYLLIPPAITIFAMVRKIPAIPAIMIGIITGLLFAYIFQPNFFIHPSDKSMLATLRHSFSVTMKTATLGYKAHTGCRDVDELLSKGGMATMLPTIWLILSAMFFAGAMEASGMLHSIAQAILKKVKSTGNIIALTLGTCFVANFLMADQYLSIVLTGRMYREIYDGKGLHRKNLSRALEDSGTLTSPLVPWNTCGSFMASSLGVPTILYLPFAFLNIITPIISLFYGYTGITIVRANSHKEPLPIESHEEKSQIEEKN
ncbi:MAG: Na+/H+ antiporter NhaC [Spirochaetes bacterium]|nr:Na+/H+ antiporter NhaC [Spirochaetota bacterium]